MEVANMERRSMKMWFRQGISISCVLLMAGMGTAMAQQPGAPPPAPAQAQAQPLTPQQMDNLVAPIALYPDPLLGQVLAASTYPVELVEASQWLQNSGGLQGQQLTDAARQQPWDASVQAMVAMPDVLAKLNQDIRWTTDLGNAFLAQPADVMAAVQRMRARAQSNGKLQSSPQETVTTANQNGQSAIEIMPADPQVIYVPTYDPTYIWGPPAYGYYPSLFYPSYGWGFYPGFNIGLCFGGWGGWGFGGWGWGWGPNWFGGGLFVNAGFFGRYGYHGYGFGGAGFRGTTAWAHDPGHRLGVGYSNAALNSRYGAASQASRISSVRAGNYQRFSQGSAANGYRGSAATSNAYRGGTPGSAGQRFGTNGTSGYQHFQEGRQSYQAPAQRNTAPAAGQRYGTPSSGQRYSAPATQHYSAPAAQHYSAPAQHYSAPSSAGHSYGGGGSVSHGSSGGGFHGGGGGHGGGRR
jgi:uncharacterized membrane protein YgcG